MPEKRKDSKGRNLRDGELQRNDGRYEYRYFDQSGQKHSVYSWQLVDTDKIPTGKRCKESLRAMEKRICKDLEEGIHTQATNKICLNNYFEGYFAGKRELKQSTRNNYRYMYDKYIKDEIGGKLLTSIKYSDIRKYYLSLIHDRGFKPNSMEIIHTILHPVFAAAVRDGYIRTNPTDGVMSEIKRSHDWEKPKRHALTEDQQTAFVDFVAKSATYNHWLPLFTLMLGTGCRIGEVVGLRWEDCDFEENLISVNHNLIYRQQSKEVPVQLRKLRREYVRYQQAELIYSLSHKKLLELASDAGAIYRFDSTVLINRDIFDAYLERFHEPATSKYRNGGDGE